MPRKFCTYIQLPPEQPNRCSLCPLVGIVPKNLRRKGSKETYVCLGTMNALTSRGITIAVDSRDKKHPLHRPCDNYWNAWMHLPKRQIGIREKAYLLCRLPYEQSRELYIHFHFKEE